MALQIGLECTGLLFTVEGDSCLDFPRTERGCGGDCASVVTGKAFLKVCRKSRVVMGLGCYIGENIDIKERHCEYMICWGKGYSGDSARLRLRPLARGGCGFDSDVRPASPSPAWLRRLPGFVSAAWLRRLPGFVSSASRLQLRRGTFSNAEGATHCAAPSAFEKVVARAGIEPATQGFSVLRSTN